MKKCDLITYQEDLEKALNHFDALANVLRVAHGNSSISERHHSECMSLICDLSNDARNLQLMVSQGITELYIIDDSVHSNSD